MAARCFMKTRQLSCFASRCLFTVLFSCLASASLLGQVIDPIIGPGVRIISPPNHAVFHAPVNIPIFTYVVDYLNTTNVEIYANGIDIGQAHSLAVAKPPGTAAPEFVWTATPRLGAVYALVWTNVLPGAYALTAVAKGRLYFETNFGSGFSRTSAPVDISVLPLPPPPTNPIPIVSIVATDPIAIEGSNSFVYPNATNATPTWGSWPPAAPAPATNWGPKDALFTVHRFGNTNNSITVTYSIGGTASNGVDYVQLPGSVTVPAGSCYALIPIVPIDHGPPYFAKTVTLSLTQPPGLSPVTYIIGCPSCATAVILPEWRLPCPLLLSDGSFHLQNPGPDGAWFIVEGSSDLTHWTPLCTNQVVNGSIDYIDGCGAGGPYRFYQAVSTLQVPSE